jgi:N utilization substance protein B
MYTPPEQLVGIVVGAKLTDLPDFDTEDIEKTEVIEHAPAATDRSAARRVALQVLYEVDSADHPYVDIIAARLLENPVSKKSERYLRRLVKGVQDHRDRLDAIIRQYASEWPLEQIAIVDRNILRLGIYELAAQPNMPVSVVIAEAMELANLFGADGSTRFINGVLGALAAAGQDVIQQILPVESEN